MRIRKFLIILFVIVTLFIFLYFENNAVVFTRYTVNSDKIHDSFDGFTIIHLSDVHGKVFRNENEKIIRLIENAKPNIIVVTGDLIDRRRYNEENALKIIDGLKDIAPIYYVTGNHEAWSGKFSSLESKLKMRGVKVLRNEKELIQKGRDFIEIIGVDDPAFSNRGYGESYRDYYIMQYHLEKILPNAKNFSILLSHRPELFSLYTESKIDLSFTGHAHGGQVILPFIGGVIAPNQGFFPKYYRGKYELDDSVMIVNAGLGNSIAPQRIFNRPEIVQVILER